MKNILLSLVLFLCFTGMAMAQSKGRVFGVIQDRYTKEALIGAEINVLTTSNTVISDENGKFELEVNAGTVSIRANYIGYTSETKYNVVVTSGNDTYLSFDLEPSVTELGAVEITFDKERNAAVATSTTPLSIQKMTTVEIKSNPGGNFDVSRVIQALPGVSGTSGSVGGFRNDIIIRGGAPNENIYLLDGIEIPVINHFSTQGSAGGPTGILNVSFMEEVTLSTSSFDAANSNALSSVLAIKQKQGNGSRHQGNLRLSATELALTMEGPVTKKLNYIASVRRSYLQLLFKALDLPIRPNYWDFQTKLSYKLNPKTSVNILGVGAIDEFAFAVPKKSTVENAYIINAVPSIQQWSYTTGVNVEHQIDKGYIQLVASRNAFSNELKRYKDNNNPIPSTLLFHSTSTETENKLALSVHKFVDGWKYSYGINAQQVSFTNDFFNTFKEAIISNGDTLSPALTSRFDTSLKFYKYGAFFQGAKAFFDNKFGVSFGLRADGNSFTSEGNCLDKTLAPRLSLWYRLHPKWKVSVSSGQYYKLPIYTVLGYQNEQKVFANKDNTYISSLHLVAGVEYLPKDDLRLTFEVFSKDYNNYPVSTTNGISLANLGGDFGAIGNEKVSSTGKGKAMGVEFYIQQKLTKSMFGVLSYTYVSSKFSGANGVLTPSAWDNKHLVSLIFGKKLGKTWEIGLKFRYAGGAPFTPFDSIGSRQNYLTQGTGTLDYSQLNADRLEHFNQVDFRIDKKWNFNHFTFDLFLDVQNILLQKTPSYPKYTFDRNEDGSFVTTDNKPIAADGSNAVPVILKDRDTIATPTIGIIVEF